MTSDRRRADRVSVDLWVEERTGDAMYLQHATNLSVTGVFLEHTLPHPPGTRVVLDLHLPGIEAPLRLVGIVAAREPDLGMGIEFVDPPDDARQALLKYVGVVRESQRPPPMPS